MSYDAKVETVSVHDEALQALGLMSGALVLAGWAGQGAADSVVAIISFSILLMILTASTLFMIEARIDETKRGAITVFCLPAVALLGVSEALFLASGFVTAALLAVGLAGVFAVYRRLVTDGVHDFLPSAMRDVGLVGGLGAASAGIGMISVSLVVG